MAITTSSLIISSSDVSDRSSLKAEDSIEITTRHSTSFLLIDLIAQSACEPASFHRPKCGFSPKDPAKIIGPLSVETKRKRDAYFEPPDHLAGYRSKYLCLLVKIFRPNGWQSTIFAELNIRLDDESKNSSPRQRETSSVGIA